MGAFWGECRATAMKGSEAAAQRNHAGEEHGAAPVQARSEVRADRASRRGRRLVNNVGGFPTAERLSRVPSMLDRLGVQVPYTT
jgi:hypothetical protein